MIGTRGVLSVCGLVSVEKLSFEHAYTSCTHVGAFLWLLFHAHHYLMWTPWKNYALIIIAEKHACYFLWLWSIILIFTVLEIFLLFIDTCWLSNYGSKYPIGQSLVTTSSRLVFILTEYIRSVILILYSCTSCANFSISSAVKGGVLLLIFWRLKVVLHIRSQVLGVAFLSLLLLLSSFKQ